MEKDAQMNKRLEWDGSAKGMIDIMNAMMAETKIGYQFNLHTSGAVARISLVRKEESNAS